MHKLNILREIVKIENNRTYVSNGFFYSDDEDVVDKFDCSIPHEMFLNLSHVVSLEYYGGIYVLKTTNGMYSISEDEGNKLMAAIN